MTASELLTKFLSDGSFWLVTGLLAYGAKTLKDVGDSIADLNKNIALIVAQVAGHSKSLEDHEARIRLVEKDED